MALMICVKLKTLVTLPILSLRTQRIKLIQREFRFEGRVRKYRKEQALFLWYKNFERKKMRKILCETFTNFQMPKYTPPLP